MGGALQVVVVVEDDPQVPRGEGWSEGASEHPWVGEVGRDGAEEGIAGIPCAEAGKLLEGTDLQPVSRGVSHPWAAWGAEMNLSHQSSLRGGRSYGAAFPCHLVGPSRTPSAASGEARGGSGQSAAPAGSR